MPAKSKSQQRFMGMVRATQKGELKDPSPEVARAAGSMTSEDARDFAGTKHEGLPDKKAAHVAMPTGDALLAFVGWGKDRSALGDGEKRAAVDAILTGSYAAVPESAADPSVLGDLTPQWLSDDLRAQSRETLSQYRHKLAGVAAPFAAFTLPDGTELELRPKEAMALPGQMPVQQPMSGTTDVQGAAGLMQQFLPQRAFSGAPAGAGGMQTGLSAGGQKAPAMPGTPGHAATNVIDQQGGLDPMGQTVDGNNAAGVAKGFKMAEWLTAKDEGEKLYRVGQEILGGAPDSQYGQQMVKIAALRYRGCELAEAIQTVKGCEPAHSRYQAHVWRERLEKEGELSQRFDSEADEKFDATTLWNGSQLRGKVARASIRSQTPVSDLTAATLLFQSSQLAEKTAIDRNALKAQMAAQNAKYRARDAANDRPSSPVTRQGLASQMGAMNQRYRARDAANNRPAPTPKSPGLTAGATGGKDPTSSMGTATPPAGGVPATPASYGQSGGGQANAPTSPAMPKPAVTPPAAGAPAPGGAGAFPRPKQVGPTAGMRAMQQKVQGQNSAYREREQGNDSRVADHIAGQGGRRGFQPQAPVAPAAPAAPAQPPIAQGGGLNGWLQRLFGG